MGDDSPNAPDTLACPICQGPLKRTSDRVIAAFECQECGPFSDFNARSARHGAGSDPGPDDSGSEPAG